MRRRTCQYAAHFQHVEDWGKLVGDRLPSRPCSTACETSSPEKQTSFRLPVTKLPCLHALL